jgi:hypothetical protein
MALQNMSLIQWFKNFFEKANWDIHPALVLCHSCIPDIVGVNQKDIPISNKELM